MIQTIHGDITQANGLILHVVNCEGAMGAGVAKVIRDKWPVVYDTYRISCDDHGSDLMGAYQVVPVSNIQDTRVVNIFAQKTYGREQGRKYIHYDALDTALKSLGERLDNPPLQGLDVNFPMMGAGLAGGSWPVIQEIIEHRIPDPVVKKLWILE